MRRISKRFPGVVALKDVDLDVRQGEVLGLIGENGAGKSTVMKILSGAYRADSGTIEVGGETVEDPTPQRMHELGVSMIYQETMLAPHLTVAENLFLGRLPRTRLGFVDWKAMARKSVEVMARLGFRVDPHARLDRISARWSKSPARCRATPGWWCSTSLPLSSAGPSSRRCSTSSGSSPPRASASSTFRIGSARSLPSATG